ncbi:MAG: fused MFS/spermidine synthase [Gammaproteobacteria bacterium]|nr:fused MFS/spermidine synthase [Gammaproteobacteria bacterium]
MAEFGRRLRFLEKADGDQQPLVSPRFASKCYLAEQLRAFPDSTRAFYEVCEVDATGDQRQLTKETGMTDTVKNQHAKPFIHQTFTTKAMYFSICEIQSRMDIRHPEVLNLEYTRSMMGFVLFEPAPANIAMIGLGGGSLAKFCYRHLPQTNIRVIEINPHVIVLRDEFLVPSDCERFNIIQGDGADFVRNPPHQFEVLLVDGYEKKGLPVRLSSQEFYDDCARTLTPGGILVVNLHLEHRHHAQHLARIRHSFGGAILVVDDYERSNSIVFAENGRSLSLLRLGPMRRPSSLDELAWRSLQGAFARILSALKAQHT